MKFRFSEEFDEYAERIGRWHLFFALIPRRVGPREWRWLVWIERKRRLIYTRENGFEWFDLFRPINRRKNWRTPGFYRR